VGISSGVSVVVEFSRIPEQGLRDAVSLSLECQAAVSYPVANEPEVFQGERR
jgi:hypothetical protein